MSATVNGTHAPVMHDEVIAALSIKPKGRYVDGTYGRGGHARSILAALDQDGRLIVVHYPETHRHIRLLAAYMTPEIRKGDK